MNSAQRRRYLRQVRPQLQLDVITLRLRGHPDADGLANHLREPFDSSVVRVNVVKWAKDCIQGKI